MKNDIVIKDRQIMCIRKEKEKENLKNTAINNSSVTSKSKLTVSKSLEKYKNGAGANSIN